MREINIKTWEKDRVKKKTQKYPHTKTKKDSENHGYA